MIYGLFYCEKCDKYTIIPPPAERCSCGNIFKYKEREIDTSQLKETLEQLKKEGKSVY